MTLHLALNFLIMFLNPVPHKCIKIIFKQFRFSKDPIKSTQMHFLSVFMKESELAHKKKKKKICKVSPLNHL